MNNYWFQRNLIFCLFFWFLSFQGIAQSTDSLAQRSIVFQNSLKQEKPFYKKLIAPAALVTAGLLTFSDNPVFDRYDVQRQRQKHFPEFRTHVDDFIPFAPIAAVYGLDVFGIKAKNNFKNLALRLLLAEVLSEALVFPMKRITNIERPDQSNFLSFPSGHTTLAFVSATFMHLEYGDLSAWYSIGAYTAATVVGALRILNNKHWLSDVLVGAGAGILSTHLAYLILSDKLRQNSKKTSFLLVPSYYDRTTGMAMILLF